MLQRLIGVSVGAILTFLLLWLSDVTNQVDRIPWYMVAIVVGALTSFFWPVVIGFWLRRRSRAQRDEEFRRTVDREVAAKSRED